MSVLLFEISEKELEEFIILVEQLYGHDFRGYSKESLRRRVLRLMSLKKCESFTSLKFHLTNQDIDTEYVLNEITVNTTEMFRDTEPFLFLRKEVFPTLETYPSVNIWHAGCSSGEEMYSLAILLHESDLLKRSIQYGTDINSEVLKVAKKGIYDLKELKEYSSGYLASGGASSLSDYYTAKYGKVNMHKFLSKNMVFTKHDLIHGTSFNQMNLIVCRNVFIYFTLEQQNKILRLFVDSLAPLGYLVLGMKESAIHSSVMKDLEVVNGRLKIYRKRAN